MTGADALVAALRDGGVDVVFGLPGVHNMAAWRALEASPIRLVAVRHEQAAAYAADGHARATGRPGAALVTTGPGAANTLGALGEAHASRSPVVLVATDVPSRLKRPGVVRGALHEGVDQAAMFAPVTKWVEVVAPGGSVGAAVARALADAAAAPSRPVYVQVPTDVLAAPAAGVPGWPVASPPPAGAAAPAPPPLPAALRSARRPLVWAGGGAQHAREEVRALARALGAPVLDTSSARGIGTVGLPPHVPEAGALWDAADVVVAVGSDLDGMSTQDWRQPQPPVLVAVNVDPADATKSYAAEVVEADARAVGAWAAELGAPREPWADVGALRSRALARLRAEHPAEVAFLDATATALPDDAVLLCDMCVAGYWLAGFHAVPAPRRLQYPMGWGTLGFAFPASLGAACAGTGPVVSVSGDGGFLFACGELATAAQHALPLTAVIVDDQAWGMLGVELPGPDLVALARSFGVRAEAVDGLGDAFAAALARHVADPAPSVLVARARLAPPPTTSPHWYRAAAPAPR